MVKSYSTSTTRPLLKVQRRPSNSATEFPEKEEEVGQGEVTRSSEGQREHELLFDSCPREKTSLFYLDNAILFETDKQAHPTVFIIIIPGMAMSILSISINATDCGYGQVTNELAFSKR
ncbi:hypothetical protein E1301_Tti005366 [Triplophysa tibetana]|uniref:Uncharacterized protein n=1 Tax=Triplophysa tibetana TaxID=1572043 RepID=A0A5A9PR62_9TELE|nr:hypothetical protein E1301_Tti005366 [Triplophysa tibetana]